MKQMMEEIINKRKEYVAPFSELTKVRMDGGFCVTASLPAKIESNKNIEVEEYNFIDNQITFE